MSKYTHGWLCRDKRWEDCVWFFDVNPVWADDFSEWWPADEAECNIYDDTEFNKIYNCNFNLPAPGKKVEIWIEL